MAWEQTGGHTSLPAAGEVEPTTCGSAGRVLQTDHGGVEKKGRMEWKMAEAHSSESGFFLPGFAA